MPGRSIRDEMQKVAQPRSYGAPMGAQAPSNATDRPKVGVAPPAVQRQAMAQHEAQSSREARVGLYQKPLGSTARPSPSAPAPGIGVPNAQPAPSVLGAAQQIQGRPAMINQAVDDANK